MTQKPFGLVVFGVFSGILGVLLAVVLLALGPGRSAEAVFARAAVAGVAAFAFTAAEALIRVRPWFYRASVGLVAACCAAVLAAFTASIGTEGFIIGLVVLLFSATVIFPLLAYVRWERNRLTVPAPPAPPGAALAGLRPRALTAEACACAVRRGSPSCP
ncbi:MAG TPA: hypothetical protein VF541_04720 [Longimicrobium sp.]|jgi:FtsH-binding integral membrane protein